MPNPKIVREDGRHIDSRLHATTRLSDAMISTRHLKTYWKESLKLKREHPGAYRLGALAASFPAWKRSLRPGANPMSDRVPWLTFPAIQFLGRTLNRKMRVFEWGSGGSTLYFSRRVDELVSVEHNPIWAERLRVAMSAVKMCQWQLRLAEPERDTSSRSADPADPDGYVSDKPAYRGMEFRNYAAAIDAFPDGHFDMVSIDGRVRPSCFKHAAAKVKLGGWLILDNAERVRYACIHADLGRDQWRKHDLAGPGPYNDYFWQTCIWQRIDSTGSAIVQGQRT